MHLYRKVVPRIARDLIRTMMAQKLIEVEEDKVEEAQLDLASVMVEYLNAEEQVVKEAKEMLQKRGLGMERFNQAKKSLAEARNIRIGEEGLEDVLNQLLEILFASRNIEEIYAEDRELRKFIKETVLKYLSVSEQVDQEARARLKNLREGTYEWDIEYPRMVAQIKRQQGLAD